MSSRFLRVRQLSVVPKKAAESEPPETGAPDSGTPATATINHAESTNGAHYLGIPHSGAPVSGAPVSGARQRIRRAILAQDGHSLGEQALYEALWNVAKPLDAESRIISIGYRQMADGARMTVNNCKANVFSLMEKLAIEEAAAFTHSQGRTYRIFGYSAILQRRKTAGLMHYVRTRGVVFVDPETGSPITARNRNSTPESGIPPSGVAATGVPEKGGSGTPPSDERGAPFSVPSLNRKKSRQNIETSSLAVVVRTVQDELGPIDDSAARRILDSCYQKAPDATPEELEYFVRLQASRVRNSKRVDNPVGLLIAQVPKCFEGESFRQFREAQQQKLNQGREAELTAAARRDELRAKLDDPQTSEEEKILIRRIL